MRRSPLLRGLAALLLTLAATAGVLAAEKEQPRLDQAFDLAARGEKTAAAQILSAYLQHHGDDQETRAWYGEIQLDLLQLQEAIRALSQAVEGRDDSRALRELAEGYLLAGEPERAASVYRTLLTRSPANPSLEMLLEGLEERIRARKVVRAYDRGLGIVIILVSLLWLGLAILFGLYLERRFPVVGS